MFTLWSANVQRQGRELVSERRSKYQKLKQNASCGIRTSSRYVPMQLGNIWIDSYYITKKSADPCTMFQSATHSQNARGHLPASRLQGATLAVQVTIVSCYKNSTTIYLYLHVLLLVFIPFVASEGLDHSPSCSA